MIGGEDVHTSANRCTHSLRIVGRDVKARRRKAGKSAVARVDQIGIVAIDQLFPRETTTHQQSSRIPPSLGPQISVPTFAKGQPFAIRRA